MILIGDPSLHYLAKARGSHAVVSRVEDVVVMAGAQLSAPDEAAGVYAIPLVERMHLGSNRLFNGVLSAV
jgi:hypothetical protein